MEMKSSTIVPAPAATPAVENFMGVSESLIPAPTEMPIVEKCVATLPLQEVANGISADGLIETTAPKQSPNERAFHAFSSVGHCVADGEPLILPTGTDYLIGDRIQQEDAAMEGKVAGAATLMTAP
jgi:hypothetical protein